MDWLDLLAVQGTLKSLLQHQGSKTWILQLSAFFMVQLSQPYMTTGKTIPLSLQTFVGKVTSLLFKMLSRFVIAFLPRSKCLLISWLQLPSAVILLPYELSGTKQHPEGLPPMVQWLGILLQGTQAGKSPHASEQINPRVSTTESTCWNYWGPHTLEPVLCNSRSHHNEKPMQCS